MIRRRTRVRAVLAIPPPASPDFPALAAPLLAAAAAARGHAVDVLDLNLELFRRCPEQADLWDPGSAFRWDRPDALADNPVLSGQAAWLDRALEGALTAERPVLGLTVNSSQLHAALGIARRARSIRPDVLVVLGGPECFPLHDPSRLLLHPEVDFLVSGEGERTLPDLLDWLEAGAQSTLPAGVLRQGRDGTVEGREPLWSDDLDALPLPDWSAIDRQGYAEPSRLPLMSSRGCHRRCAFCTERHLWPGFRQRSADRVLEEILLDAEQHGATRITFTDSTFNAEIGFLDALCHRLVVAGSPVRWAGQGVFRPEMHRARLRLLARAGCELIDFGLESGSERVLRAMRKGQTAAEATRVLKDCHSAGIATVVNVMVGFPGEEDADLEQTLTFLRRNHRHIDKVNPCASFCGVEPGSDLHRRHADFGVRFVKHHYYWETEDGSNTLAVRLHRYERVLELVADLGLACTYPGRRVINRHQILGDFHANLGEHEQAAEHYRRHREKILNYALGVVPSSHSRM